jgi:hypothetical protein
MKQFEISLPKAVYFGTYFIDDKLACVVIEECYTTNEDSERIEIDSLNDAEIFKRIYSILNKEKADEIAEQTFVFTFIDGAVFKGTGAIVGDIKGNKNAGLINSFKCSGGGKLERIA